jgi:hypothetical protein
VDTKESLNKKIEKIDKIYDEINRGQSADSILRMLNPLIEERLGLLLSQFEKCPPDLGALLSLQSRISEVWRIREELIKAKKLGLSAQSILEGVMQINSSGNRT